MEFKYPPEFKILKERYKLFTLSSYEQKRLSCKKCQDILIRPVQSECGCRFCEHCTFTIKNHCPECGEKWEENSYTADKAIEKEISTSTVKCPNTECNEKYQLKDWQSHRINCQHTNQNCPNQCNVKIRDTLEDHLPNCKRTPTECPMRHMGCNKILPKEELRKHLNDEIIYHLGLFTLQFNQLMTEREDLEKRRKEIITKEENITGKGRNIHDTIQQLSKRITILENHVGPSIKIPVQPLQSTPTTSEVQDGNFIWKIDNIINRIREAKRNIDTQILSEKFYTHRPGYGIRLKLFPGGDGQRAENYISLYFMIVKGEYDEEIEWPFKKKVSLTLIANEKTIKNHTINMKPDHNPQCYGKPSQPNNIAAGQPYFISHVELINSDEFIKENTITIQAKIL